MLTAAAPEAAPNTTTRPGEGSGYRQAGAEGGSPHRLEDDVDPTSAAEDLLGQVGDAELVDHFNNAIVKGLEAASHVGSRAPFGRLDDARFQHFRPGVRRFNDGAHDGTVVHPATAALIGGDKA